MMDAGILEQLSDGRYEPVDDPERRAQVSSKHKMQKQKEQQEQIPMSRAVIEQAR